MSEDKDLSQDKTEQPTLRRLEKAKEQGQIPQSKDLYHAALLSLFAFYLIWQGPKLFQTLFRLFQHWFEGVGDQTMTGRSLHNALAGLALKIGGHLTFWAILLVACILSFGFLQTRLQFVWKKIEPNLDRLSLQQSLKRFFSLQALFEFLKSFIKMTVLFALSAGILWWQDTWMVLCGQDMKYFFAFCKERFFQLFMFLGLAVFVIASLDYGYQWFEWLKKLMMSRHELQEEQKETEKSVEVKRRQQQKRQEVAHMKRIQEVLPDTTVLVVNPTHYAISLEWKPHKMMAPTVLEKAKGNMAIFMRRLAEASSIPVVENKALAPSLYETSVVGKEINPAHYKAVAQVIHYVNQIKEQRREAKPS